MKTLAGLHICNFNPNAIKPSEDVKHEMERMNDKVLLPLPTIANPVIPTDTITVALLNTRSLVSKLPDIAQDACLTSAHVVCLTETWLQPGQTSPQLSDHPSVVRLDRETSNNRGGLLINVHKSIQVCTEATIALSNILIEAITTTLLLPNHELLQVTVVYRSPSALLKLLHPTRGVIGTPGA